MNPVPTQPAWFHRLNQILKEIRGLPVGHLDRLAIERIFLVGERRARHLMAGLPGIQVGNAFAVERLALLEYLKSIQASDVFERELSRRVRVSDHLEASRKQIAARRVVIPVMNGPIRSLERLGNGVVLGNGELRVQFKTAEELAAKLFQLAQTMADDWGAFLQKVEASSGG